MSMNPIIAETVQLLAKLDDSEKRLVLDVLQLPSKERQAAISRLMQQYQRRPGSDEPECY